MRRQGITRTSHFTPKSVVGNGEALWQSAKRPTDPQTNGAPFLLPENSQTVIPFAVSAVLIRSSSRRNRALSSVSNSS